VSGALVFQQRPVGNHSGGGTFLRCHQASSCYAQRTSGSRQEPAIGDLFGNNPVGNAFRCLE
jgi:hypothetical protein